MDVWLPESMYKAVPWLCILLGSMLIWVAPPMFNIIIKWVAVVFFIGYGLSILCARFSYSGGEYTRMCILSKREKKE